MLGTHRGPVLDSTTETSKFRVTFLASPTQARRKSASKLASSVDLGREGLRFVVLLWAEQASQNQH